MSEIADISARISKKTFLWAAVILLCLLVLSGILTRVIPTGSYLRSTVDGKVVIDVNSFEYTQLSPLAYSLGWDALTALGMSVLAMGFGFAAGLTNPFTIARGEYRLRGARRAFLQRPHRHIAGSAAHPDGGGGEAPDIHVRDFGHHHLCSREQNRGHAAFLRVHNGLHTRPVHEFLHNLRIGQIPDHDADTRSAVRHRRAHATGHMPCIPVWRWVQQRDLSDQSDNSDIYRTGGRELSQMVQMDDMAATRGARCHCGVPVYCSGHRLGAHIAEQAFQDS